LSPRPLHIGDARQHAEFATADFGERSDSRADLGRRYHHGHRRQAGRGLSPRDTEWPHMDERLSQLRQFYSTL